MYGKKTPLGLGRTSQGVSFDKIFAETLLGTFEEIPLDVYLQKKILEKIWRGLIEKKSSYEIFKGLPLGRLLSKQSFLQWISKNISLGLIFDIISLE